VRRCRSAGRVAGWSRSRDREAGDALAAPCASRPVSRRVLVRRVARLGVTGTQVGHALALIDEVTKHVGGTGRRCGFGAESARATRHCIWRVGSPCSGLSSVARSSG
jgi:hypothetical protein